MLPPNVNAALSTLPQQPPSPCISCQAKVRDWPDLQPHSITFSGGHVVNKDTLADFSTPHWLRGRSQKEQSPVCYTRHAKVTLTAVFEVTKHPTNTETVSIRGKAVCHGETLAWTVHGIAVSPGAATVSIPATLSSHALPNIVACYDPLTIAWEMTQRDGSWKSIGATHHLLYATLADPNGTPAYWTLLDVSCRAAQGQSTIQGVVTHAFNPLRVPGPGIKRKRDNHALTYWNPETTTATNTQELLQSADGSGQCGSWAEFLVDMYKVHGILTVDKILVIYAPTRRDVGFLVKNWTFVHPPRSTAHGWTHTMRVNCKTRPPNGIPGQSNPNPPPAFYNHFIVHDRTTKKFYDPSYGAGPFASQDTWERAAIAGLFRDGASPNAGHDTSLHPGRLLKFYNLTNNTLIP